VEPADGQRVEVSAELKPDLRPGQYVLVDRGLIIKTVADEEALTILEMYAEIGELLDAEDGLPPPHERPALIH
jgi:hydrogenase maturation factor